MDNVYRELLLGCGSNWEKKLSTSQQDDGWQNLITLDYYEGHSPHVVHDLRDHPLPFPDNYFDEIHAYEVLEHLAQQGDYEFFFSEWNEYYRILKPGGMFFGTVPRRDSVWAYGDPSHTRIIVPENFVFLNQGAYEAQVGKTPMSDFRHIYNGDFDVIAVDATQGGDSMAFILEAINKIIT